MALRVTSARDLCTSTSTKVREDPAGNVRNDARNDSAIIARDSFSDAGVICNGIRSQAVQSKSEQNVRKRILLRQTRSYSGARATIAALHRHRGPSSCRQDHLSEGPCGTPARTTRLRLRRQPVSRRFLQGKAWLSLSRPNVLSYRTPETPARSSRRGIPRPDPFGLPDGKRPHLRQP